MKGTRSSPTAFTRSGAGLLAVALAVACAPKALRRQTDIMAKTGVVSVSAPVLRARVNDLAERLSGRIEETTNQIRRDTKDPVIRRRALTARIEAIPSLYAAAYRADPLEAAMDVWALAFQMSQLVTEGEGRDFYGQQQPLVRELAQEVLADADAVVKDIATNPGAFADARARIEGWAKRHPIERNFTARASIAAYMAEMRSERDAFVAVGAATDTLENLSQRLNTYAAQLPKQARWQAELLVADMTTEPDVAAVLSDVHALGATARSANELIGDVPELLGGAGSPVRELLAAERRAVLEGVDAQRRQTLEYVTAERLATLAVLREERVAVVEALHQERVETLKEVDAIKTRAVESAVGGLRDLVDYALWRVAALLFALMLAAATLGVIAYWLTLGRRPPAV